MMKTKITIALAIDPSGDWNTAGWKGPSKDELMSHAIDPLEGHESRYFIEVEVDVPEPVTIKAIAKEAQP